MHVPLIVTKIVNQRSASSESSKGRYILSISLEWTVNLWDLKCVIPSNLCNISLPWLSSARICVKGERNTPYITFVYGNSGKSPFMEKGEYVQRRMWVLTCCCQSALLHSAGSYGWHHVNAVGTLNPVACSWNGQWNDITQTQTRRYNWCCRTVLTPSALLYVNSLYNLDALFM